jgi:hypothetical protein
MFLPTHTPEQRLAVFRDLRQRSDLTPHIIAQAFSDVKITPRYLDFYTPASWPSVFDIVCEGYFCQSGVTLIMTSVLHYAGFMNSDQLRLEAISNDVNGHQGLVLYQDGSCYNFLPGELVSEQYARDHSVQLDSHKIKPDNLFH